MIIYKGWLLLVTWNYIISLGTWTYITGCKLLVLDQNTWNHVSMYKLFVIRIVSWS